MAKAAKSKVELSPETKKAVEEGNKIREQLAPKKAAPKKESK